MKGLGAKFLVAIILGAIAWEHRVAIVVLGLLAVCVWCVGAIVESYLPEPECKLDELLQRCESGLERKLASALFKRFSNRPDYHLSNQVEIRPPGKQGRPYRPDFLIERRVGLRTIRCIVEADGPMHFTPEGKAHDRKRDRLFRQAGYIVKRFNAKEIGRDPDDCALEVGHAIEIASAPYEPQKVSSPQ